MDVHEWINQITDSAAVADIADMTGISARTLHHQLKMGKLSLENIIKIAEAYNAHPIRALADFGVMSAAWIQVPDVKAALRLASDDELVDEVLRRLKAGSRSFEAPVDELSPRRTRRSSDFYDMPDTAVADESPEEGDGDPGAYEP